jgi:hypothetical protein
MTFNCCAVEETLVMDKAIIARKNSFIDEFSRKLKIKAVKAVQKSIYLAEALSMKFP